MNKTLSIGLAGYSFMIEEHAYIKLSDYLAALRNSLDATEADEVMHDIEIRMVEIFKEALGKREVINDTDVERVIFQIGTPEKIEEQEEAYFSEKNNTTSSKTTGNTGTGTTSKQMFRDPSNQKIGGVCSGLAQYIGLDVTLMRLIWVGLFLLLMFAKGSGMFIVLCYIILWIVLPKAQTASDFLKMKGQPVNFDNLKNESNKIIEFANESTQRVGELYNENKPYINKAGNGIANGFRYFFGVIFALMAASCIVGAFTMFGFIGNFGELNFMGNIGFFLKDQNMEYIIVAFIFLSSFIPGLIFAFISMKLLAPKTKLKYTGLVFGGLVLLWLVLVGIIAGTAIRQGTLYSGHSEDSENVAIATKSDTLYVDLKKLNVPSNFRPYWNNIYSDGKTIFKKDYPDVEVIKKDVKEPYLIIRKSADGDTQQMQMRVPVEIQGNTIFVPNYVTYPYEQRFRKYSVDYQLIVPKNKTVISKAESGIYMDYDNDDDNHDSDNDDENVSIKANGNTIEYNSSMGDSIIINGKKYPKELGNKIVNDSLKHIKSIDDVKVKIKSGKDEISIKTN